MDTNNGNNIQLTSAEWYVMECLWENAPKTGREIIDELKIRVGWSKSTVLTMLNRMVEKGLIFCDENTKVRLYSTKIDRHLAAQTETENFLKRVYKGSVGLMMSAMTKEQKLTDEEIDELYKILEESRNR